MIDLGLAGAAAGGELMAEGPTEDIAQVSASPTGTFLQDSLRQQDQT